MILLISYILTRCSHDEMTNTLQIFIPSTIHIFYPRVFRGTAVEGAQEEVKINIFSVASGHLYERFLRIMILSVLNHTNTPVKFWFIKNYLSPKFKDVIPFMAKRYNFEYELVTYKWPHFLNKQTDKIRIIWANKILFLDVLFPITLKKVLHLLYYIYRVF